MIMQKIVNLNKIFNRGRIYRKLKGLFKKIPFVRKTLQTCDNQVSRDEFVIAVLKEIPAGKSLLDAGCGSQGYRKYCNHLVYKAQDFNQFKSDEIPSFSGFREKYQYGEMDYIGNIWDIAENDETFDVILCTEVLEHVVYPIDTIKEFSSLLKTGGKLILTAPANSPRHMDPYYFYSGFSNRWYEKILTENRFKIDRIYQYGDYYSWMRYEMFRVLASANLFTAFFLLPTFIYFSLKNKTPESMATLCEGYYIIATKI
jgi:SAM-dependent methyltransferase